MVSFRIDWFDLLAVQGTLKNIPPAPQFKSINSFGECGQMGKLRLRGWTTSGMGVDLGKERVAACMTSEHTAWWMLGHALFCPDSWHPEPGSCAYPYFPEEETESKKEDVACSLRATLLDSEPAVTGSILLHPRRQSSPLVCFKIFLIFIYLAA